MADKFRKVRAGDPLDIPAPVYNEMLDALAWVRTQTPAGGGSGVAPLLPGMIYVQNNSGAGRGRFEVLGLRDVAITPSANLTQFLAGPILTGVVPAVDTDKGKFAVAVEPIAPGKLGRAWVAGVCLCRVNIVSANDKNADVTDGDATQLTSGDGSAQILWAETGTGTKWALVRLGGGSPSPTPCLVKKDGGGDADGTHFASWTYSVYKPSDTGLSSPILTAVPVVASRARLNAIPGISPAASGSAAAWYRGVSGTPVLTDVQETWTPES